MLDERRNLIFRTSMALTKGLGLIRGVKPLNEEQRKRVAEIIIHELEATNWKISLGEGVRPPRQASIVRRGIFSADDIVRKKTTSTNA